ncbi:MAG: L-threonylcarbamoyladenylate synthase [Patescibacteria group bacterium]
MRIIRVDLTKDFSEAIAEAIAILKMGGTIVYPTDTVYGLGCNALDDIAVRHVFDIKNRSSRPLPILVRNMRWLEELADINTKQKQLVNKFLPGKFTLVLPKKDIVPPMVTTGLPTAGFRMIDYNFTNELLDKFGYPLVTTSATVSGEATSGDIEKVIALMANNHRRPDLIIDAGVLPVSNASVVIDCSTEKPKVLRVGPSKPEDLLKLLEI